MRTMPTPASLSQGSAVPTFTSCARSFRRNRHRDSKLSSACLLERKLGTTQYAERHSARLNTPPAQNATASAYRFGPIVEAGRTTFRLWAPNAARAEVIIDGRANVAMQRADHGFLVAEVDRCGHGDRYKFKVGDLTFPDLASRQQDGHTSG